MIFLPADAYILAGGQSKRFGTNKARHEMDGRPMIRVIADQLKGKFQSVTVISKIAHEYDDLGLQTIADQHQLQAPISGILTALKNASEPWIFIAPCDTPDLDIVTVDQLWEGRSKIGAVPHVDGQLHPLTAFYHTSAMTLFQDAFVNERYSLHDIIRGSDVGQVNFDSDNPFRNINMVTDL